MAFLEIRTPCFDSGSTHCTEQSFHQLDGKDGHNPIFLAARTSELCQALSGHPQSSTSIATLPLRGSYIPHSESSHGTAR